MDCTKQVVAFDDITGMMVAERDVSPKRDNSTNQCKFYKDRWYNRLIGRRFEIKYCINCAHFKEVGYY
jgi:hypothetical protein